MTANPEASPAEPDSEPRAADGRVPGRRGQATRQKLLDCTADMLRTTSYRDLKVVDIAREAGTSPATFYQYFPDVESAIRTRSVTARSVKSRLWCDVIRTPGSISRRICRSAVFRRKPSRSTTRPFSTLSP